MYRRRLRRAFTLVELLVVVAVIGVLTAILIPSLAVAKERARRVVCSKNVNQFIVGCLNYADSYDEDLPSGKSDMGSGDDEHIPVMGRSAGDAMAAIVGDHQVMKCPWLGKPFNGDSWWYYDGYGYVLGYNYLGGHDATPWSSVGPVTAKWKSLQFSHEPSTLVLVSELNFWVPAEGRTFAPHGSRGPINLYIEPGSGGGMTPEEAGAAGGNVGMMDGSVRWKKMDAMEVYRGSRMHPCYAVW